MFASDQFRKNWIVLFDVTTSPFKGLINNICGLVLSIPKFTVVFVPTSFVTISV
jgi:hypothetical protein